jgi:peroxiredoxin
VDAFVHHREKVSAADSRAVLPPAAPHTPAAASDPKSAGIFPDFSGRDTKGRAVSLSGLDARVIIVSFWSPGTKTSQNQLTSVLPLYNQFHRRGLAAVGISMDPDPRRILPSLDDVTIPWPQISDRAGLATHYDVDPRAGKTFVLDASHHIIASGTMGPQMEATIRNLLFPPEI